MKTSSRSAKDATILDGKLNDKYQLYLSEQDGEATSDADVDINTKVIALLNAATDLLAVCTGGEVVEQFTHSKRIYQDMMVARRYPKTFCENFVVRCWIRLDVEFEFRAFVVNRRITALSQYT